MNRPHTVIAVGETDIIAAIAGMISTLGTRHEHNCLKFDEDGPNRFTSVWRLTDRTSGFGVSFRKGQDDPDRAYYRTAWDAAEAIHEGKHTPAALLTKEGI
jgi:hypothetical protein